MPARRIKVPECLNLASHRKMRSHWDWYWKHEHKNTPKRIIVDFDKKPD